MQPFGPRRGDYQAAVIAKTIADVNRGKHQPYKLTEFLLEFGEPERKQLSSEEMIAKVREINALLGGVEVSRSQQPQLVGPSGAPITSRPKTEVELRTKER